MSGNGHIAIVGSGPAEAELRAQAGQLRLDDRVTFLGFIGDADLVALYSLVDVFGIPSEADLQSITTMEAMACGLPVVAADAYALPELVHHGENGFLFQPGNSVELAGYLDLLLADPGQRARMGAKSLEIIAAHDRVQVLARWDTLYRRLANEFVDAKERRLQLRMERKRPGYIQQKSHRPRLVRTGELALDQFYPNSEVETNGTWHSQGE